MADPDKREPFPPSAEPDEAEEEPEAQSTLSEEEARRLAEQEVEAIDEEVDPQVHKYDRGPKGLPTAEGEGQSFVDRAWDRQHKIEARLKRVGHGRYSRVLRMARKPEHDEFVRASQITAIGILIVGTLGFIIFLLTSWLWGILNIK